MLRVSIFGIICLENFYLSKDKRFNTSENILCLYMNISTNKTLNKQQVERVGLGCRFQTNCPLVGPGPIGGVPSVGVFLRDPSPYL